MSSNYCYEIQWDGGLGKAAVTAGRRSGCCTDILALEFEATLVLETTKQALGCGGGGWDRRLEAKVPRYVRELGSR